MGSYAQFYSFRLEWCSQKSVSGSWIATSEKIEKRKTYGRILFTLSSSLIKAYYWRLASKKGMYGQFHIMDITFRGHFFGNKNFSYMLLSKVPVSSKFLFSYLIYISPNELLWKKIDLDKMQSLLEVSQTFKFAAILVHYSHQSSLIWNELRRRLRNTWLQAWLISLVLPL